MAIVMKRDGTLYRRVKNLRWLLKNWKHIEQLEWTSLDDHTRKILGVHPVTDGIFQARLCDGRIYETTYASFEVWKRFINRPVFRGLPIKVNGFEGIV